MILIDKIINKIYLIIFFQRVVFFRNENIYFLDKGDIIV
jgi:hypothetical protein